MNRLLLDPLMYALADRQEQNTRTGVWIAINRTRRRSEFGEDCEDRN